MVAEKPEILRLSADVDYYAHQLLEAETFLMRVHYCDHIHRAWTRLKKELEHFIKTGNAEPETKPNRYPAKRKRDESKRPVHAPEHRLEPDRDANRIRFRDVTMADGAAMLLGEKGHLHGREIERLLKEGGYRSKSQFFQNVLDAAFKRDGRFRNVGGNTWELKEPLLLKLPPNGKVEAAEQANKEET